MNSKKQKLIKQLVEFIKEDRMANFSDDWLNVRIKFFLEEYEGKKDE